MKLSLRQNASVSPDDLSSGYKSLDQCLDSLASASQDLSFGSPESFLACIDDADTLERLTRLVEEKVKNKGLKTIFVIGIGGANLATKAIYDACVSLNSFNEKKTMVFLDTVDISVSELALSHIKTLNLLEEFIVVIVSKSGKTLETLANAEFLLSHLESRFGSITERIVVISGKDTPLWSDAASKNISCVPVSETISDRFSAFSVTTLVPLAFWGFQISEILNGAREIRKQSLSKRNNLALESAIILSSFHKKGFNIYDLFFFSPRLETLGKWQKQLIAESLGKEKDLDGKVVHAGITPVVSIGTTDLHSSLQLTLAGPRDRITAFISVMGNGVESIGDSASLNSLPKNITAKSLNSLDEIILKSVQESYAQNGLPFWNIQLADVSLESLGEYMMFTMFQTVFLGALWNVNAFDQPNVERYKEITRQMLQ